MVKVPFTENCLPATAPIVGVLLINLGTPAAPTPAEVRSYLAEFLLDPRVVEMPRWLWRMILYGIILPLRPRRTARAYAKIWTAQGSPLLVISQAQTKALQAQLNCPVALGMRYGKPSVAEALTQLQTAKVQRLIILPLYPQYSAATTASALDAALAVFKTWRRVPDFHFIASYYNHPAYIQALAAHLDRYWQEHGKPEQLLFSFHGMPKRTFLAGDPYFCHCQETARLVAQTVDLPANFYRVTFQSRFGREEWLKPYTDHHLQALAHAGVKRVDVICPGFAADCLETLEEIAQFNRELFLQAGGETFHYIPALNDSPAHIQALADIIAKSCYTFS